KELVEHTKRNTIAYYSGFLSKPGVQQLGINDEDMNGFMMAVHGLDKGKGLDLILHTPGGSIATTESVVNYLHLMFHKDMRVIVPQIAMSAGTMIACSSREIILGKQSSLGPIDPQVRDIAAQGILNEFKRALEEIKGDANAVQVWRWIIQQYRPTFLGECEQAILWTKAFVGNMLREVMFEGDADASLKAQRIVDALSDAEAHKSHERHIPIAKCRDIGLNVRALEDDNRLQDLVLTVHHCYMFVLMNSPTYKIIENHNGAAFVKAQQMPMQMPMQLIPQMIKAPK
ncbi:MAG: SDH family Clp fold serine proteinase, partial [Candidatus Korobacteraceae bacterium]